MKLSDLIRKKSKEAGKENLLSAATPHLKVVRGPDGKFISKNKSSVTPTPVLVPVNVRAVKKNKQKKPVTKSPVLEVSNFKKVPIRRFYTHKKWLFVIEDITLLANVSNTQEYLHQIRSVNAELTKNWETMTEKISFVFDGQRETLECADAENTLKIVLAFDKPLSGPFFRWLKETSKKVPV